jgi:hypothetical protein
MTELEEPLPIKYKALSSNRSTTKRKKKEKKKVGVFPFVVGARVKGL